MPQPLPTYFLSHGGGPWPWMAGPERAPYRHLEAFLAAIPGSLPQPPVAALVVTGHWEARAFTVSSAARPGMIYDYYGFAPDLYRISYPAPGHPALAERVQALLAGAGWEARCDPARGFDHGTFSVMRPIAPEADLPVVQLSLRAGLDPDQHFRAGQALAPLRTEGVLILGSGLSYHNLRAWGPAGAPAAAAFDGWLRRTLLDLPPADRRAALAAWTQAPAARQAHPREDHLIPLMVAAGAAEADPATCVYGERFMGLAVSAYRFGADTRPSGFDALGQG